jgi:formylglycine-generating enzyme required for sulfatase activity
MHVQIGDSFTLDDLALPATAKPLILRWVPPGTFRMGDPGMYADGGEPFVVVLTRGFWMGQYLVTQAQWSAVMPFNPSHVQTDGTNRPVEMVNWDEALAFCATLQRQIGDRLPPGYRFSLPTEAQWEYACRAGTQTRYYNGDTLADLDQIAWHRENSGGETHPVGEKMPNQWGLYDMIGNVFELCFDEMRMGATMYPTGVVADWIGTSALLHPHEHRIASEYHVIRSGSYNTPRASEVLWCSGHFEPGATRHDFRRPGIGVRLCVRA